MCKSSQTILKFLLVLQALCSSASTSRKRPSVAGPSTGLPHGGAKKPKTSHYSFEKHSVDETVIKLVFLDIKTLDDNIEKQKNLTILDFHGNELEELPSNIVKLEKLEMLILDNNKLNVVPNTIGRLRNLGMVYLNDNCLVLVPSTAGRLTKLKLLDLKNNRLLNLPSTMEHLSGSLKTLNLQDNKDFQELGVGTTFGKIELKAVFGEAAKFSSDPIMEEEREIPEQEAYERLKTQPIHWDFGKLEIIESPYIPTSMLNEGELMGLWNEQISIFVSDAEKKETMRAFIHHIYNPGEEYGGWPMLSRYLDLAKNLIGSIFDILSKVTGDDQKIISIIDKICEGLEECPDRQISAMMFAHCLVTDRIRENGPLEDFVKLVIVQEREKVFNITAMPAYTEQSMGFLSYWKRELHSRLGLYFDTNTAIEVVGQDRFKGWRGNVLWAFYSKFTPEFIITEVTRRINGNTIMLNKASAFLHRDKAITAEEKGRMYISSKGHIIFANAITEEFVKYFLLKKMKIIVEREGSQPRAGTSTAGN